ncbi:hypothetical protein ABES02_26315 [Neobacillus pocheonensis]
MKYKDSKACEAEFLSFINNYVKNAATRAQEIRKSDLSGIQSSIFSVEF